jgi:transcription antitermination factor NusG
VPILTAEPELHPPDLWTTRLADEGVRWWCLHTRPRQEKTTARHLRKCRIAYYAPVIARESRTPGGRRIVSVVPLFSSYVFLRGGDRERLEAFRGNSLVQVLEVADQDGLDRDLRQIHSILGFGLTVTAEPAHPVGSRVVIRSGPLAGLTGIIARRDGRDRFTAVVRFLGQGVTVALEDWQVERAGDSN